MKPFKVVNAYMACMKLNTPQGYILAASLMMDFENNGQWPERPPECLESHRCHCARCTTGRAFMRLLGGSEQQAAKRAINKLHEDPRKASEIFYEHRFNQYPEWLKEIIKDE